MSGFIILSWQAQHGVRKADGPTRNTEWVVWEAFGVPTPRMDWDTSNLPDAWCHFKQHADKGWGNTWTRTYYNGFTVYLTARVAAIFTSEMDETITAEPGPILAYFDPTEEVTLQVDASKHVFVSSQAPTGDVISDTLQLQSERAHALPRNPRQPTANCGMSYVTT